MIEELDADTVPFETWWAAKRMRRLSADLLGLADPPPITWTTTGSLEARGLYMASRKCIYIAVDQGVTEVLRTVAHELRHVVQMEAGEISMFRGITPPPAARRAEAEAHAFEDVALDAYTSRYGHPPR